MFMGGKRDERGLVSAVRMFNEQHLELTREADVRLLAIESGCPTHEDEMDFVTKLQQIRRNRRKPCRSVTSFSPTAA